MSMVYNGTSIYLNNLLWNTHFMLPTISTQIRSIQNGTNIEDINIGEMFLNFMMHKSLRNFCDGIMIKISNTPPSL